MIPVGPLLALMLALPAVPQDAKTQCRLCGQGSGLAAEEVAVTPVTLEVETRLDFDQVVLTGPAGGTARLSPAEGNGTSGAVQTLSPRAMAGEVVIRGEPGRSVRVALPGRIELHGSSGSLTITRITSDLPPLPRLDAQGRLRFRFGGELFVSGDAEGSYRGDVQITVDYL